MSLRAASVVWLLLTLAPTFIADPASASFVGPNKVVNARLGTTTLLAPTAVASTASGAVVGCNVNITWNNPQPDVVTQWSIQRYKNGLIEDSPIIVSTTSYRDGINLSLLTTYGWRVRAIAGTNWVGPEVTTTHYLTVACL